ncbi:hypothetical protein M405DRAFT_74880 [Rhizopogon salebrosus TDB-379]|nr:hypothetical protein M405DRAFT_74880 [Rhizopogon salebrosus TDB-379]
MTRFERRKPYPPRESAFSKTREQTSIARESVPPMSVNLLLTITGRCRYIPEKVLDLLPSLAVTLVYVSTKVDSPLTTFL